MNLKEIIEAGESCEDNGRGPVSGGRKVRGSLKGYD